MHRKGGPAHARMKHANSPSLTVSVTTVGVRLAATRASAHAEALVRVHHGQRQNRLRQVRSTLIRGSIPPCFAHGFRILRSRVIANETPATAGRLRNRVEILTGPPAPPMATRHHVRVVMPTAIDRPVAMCVRMTPSVIALRAAIRNTTTHVAIVRLPPREMSGPIAPSHRAAAAVGVATATVAAEMRHAEIRNRATTMAAAAVSVAGSKGHVATAIDAIPDQRTKSALLATRFSESSC